MPPSPSTAPPRADRLPAITVLSVDSTVIWPPLPERSASAATDAPGAMLTSWAAGAGVPTPPRARASVVPIATVPPPPRPEALIRLPAVRLTSPVACTATWPPRLRRSPMPRADMAPETIAAPPSASISTVPPRRPLLSAEITPPAVTRLVTMPSTAAVDSVMRPPSAAITPSLVTSAACPRAPWIVCRLTSIDSSPSPYRSTTLLATPSSDTVPNAALIRP